MEIVDYKTASIRDGTVLELAYRVQLSLYIMAAEKLYLGYKATAAKLHFFKNQKEDKLDMSELYELRAKVEETVAYIQNNNADAEYECNKQDNCKFCPYNYICNI